MMGATLELLVRGHSRMYWNWSEHTWTRGILLGFVMPVIWQSVLEYYWHRFLHAVPWVYARFHKVHHYYTSPQPFDDMHIHPLEAWIYFCILYSPPFVFPMHPTAFAAYMIVHGVTGVLDHCGLAFEIPLVYNTRDHDNHHRLFTKNYGFPFPWLDIIHNTYSGSYWGRSYV